MMAACRVSSSAGTVRKWHCNVHMKSTTCTPFLINPCGVTYLEHWTSLIYHEKQRITPSSLLNFKYVFTIHVQYNVCSISNNSLWLDIFRTLTTLTHYLMKRSRYWTVVEIMTAFITSCRNLHNLFSQLWSQSFSLLKILLLTRILPTVIFHFGLPELWNTEKFYERKLCVLTCHVLLYMFKFDICTFLTCLACLGIKKRTVLDSFSLDFWRLVAAHNSPWPMLAKDALARKPLGALSSHSVTPHLREWPVFLCRVFDRTELWEGCKSRSNRESVCTWWQSMRLTRPSPMLMEEGIPRWWERDNLLLCEWWKVSFLLRYLS